MSLITANFDEVKQSQLPFVELLVNMGYTYLSTEEVMRRRGGDESKFLLKDIAIEALMRINDYEHNSKLYKFSEKDVTEAVDELENLPYEGLIDTSKKVYNMIMPATGGKTIKVFHDGKGVSKSFKYIDFANPENNVFHVAVEFTARGKGDIRPDIVCFVNGIPFVVIENKKSATDVEEAINQHVRNQGADKCPRFYTYPQLLIGTNKDILRYGTTGTPTKFYVAWKEKKDSKTYKHDLKDLGARAQELVKTTIDTALYAQICTDLNGSTVNHRQVVKRKVTEQDRGIVALFEPARLLDLAKNYIIYDAGIKKIMRYQQYFAINKMLKRINEWEDGVDGKRRMGGLVWHTQGSGKSLTMVMFVKALIEDSNISNPRVIVVTDRKDLDKQIKDTFQNCGLKKGVIQAKSGEDLLKLVKAKKLDVITTLVHKFESAAKKKSGFKALDSNIFVLIDEAHRSQYGIANLEMNRIIPNACYIGFTGTPLMKDERQSWKKFGGYIDRYTIDDAREDKIILPLIYEGRYVDLQANKKQIDRLTDRIFKDLGAKKKKELQKFVDNKVIKDNPQRIAEIAWDIQEHFVENFKGTGLKAQVVAPSKFSAVLMKKCFDDGGVINSAVVISDENGIVDVVDEHRKEVIDYLNKAKEKYRSLESYEKDVIDSFKNNEEGVEIIIVVDKLLTGFDAPRNTVLYLAKDLKDHNLLQAIARVNRLFDNKAMPKTSGFIVDYSENAKNLDTAMKLFGNYDEEDVKGALIDIDEKINELEQAYAEVHDLFKGVKNKKDDQEYIEYLGGKSQEDGEQKRRLFYDELNNLMRVFNECMALQDFGREFKHLATYNQEIKKLINLRKTVNLKYADREDMERYKNALRNIIDQNVIAEGVELLTEQIDITDKKKFEEVIESLGSNKSKAEAIAAQTKKTISESFETDPEFYQRFSDKIEDLLKKMREGKMSDLEVLKIMKQVKDDVLDKKDESLPSEIEKHKGADVFYRNLQGSFEGEISDKDYLAIVLGIYEIVKKESIVDWYKNLEVKRRMMSKLDDYLYDVVKGEMGIDLPQVKMREIIEDVIKLAVNNHEVFKK